MLFNSLGIFHTSTWYCYGIENIVKDNLNELPYIIQMVGPENYLMWNTQICYSAVIFFCSGTDDDPKVAISHTTDDGIESRAISSTDVCDCSGMRWRWHFQHIVRTSAVDMDCLNANVVMTD